VAVEEDGEAVLGAELVEKAIKGCVVGVVVRAKPALEIGGRAKSGTSRMVCVRTTPRRERTSPSRSSKSSRRRLTSTNMREIGVARTVAPCSWRSP